MDESPHPLFDWRIVEGGGVEAWVSWLSPREAWVLSEHRILGEAVLPGTAYTEMARAAFELSRKAPLGADEALEIRDLTLFAPLAVGDDEECEVRTVLRKDGGAVRFAVKSRTDGTAAWREHAAGEVAIVAAGAPVLHDVAAMRRQCGEQDLVGRGEELAPRREHVTFGPRWTSAWRGLRRVRLGADCQLAELEIDAKYAGELDTFWLHPALLDVAVTFVHPPRDGDDGPFLPFAYERLRMRRALPRKLLVFMQRAGAAGGDMQRFDVTIMDEQGREVVKIDQYALRRLAAQPEPEAAPARGAAGAGANRILRIATPGLLETLAFVPGPRTAPGPGEIEIEVETCGLAFKDVLFALGVLPSEGATPEFGYECAGRVAAVGKGVSDLAPGDEVLAIGLKCFRAFATTEARLAARKPARLSFAEAATVPNAYFTAYYALVTCGRLQRGERVLIHTAAGGVGLAAVHIAKWLGAEIFATAGSAEKRAFLSSLGIEHVMDSRSVAFADQVLEQTDGKGVDVVLNALAGEYIAKGLAVLGQYGRFLELGVRDIYNDTPVGLRPFAKGLSFIAVMVTPDIPGYREIWLEVIRLVETGVLPPLPHRVFRSREVGAAFEHMARARHIGKVVVSLRND